MQYRIWFDIHMSVHRNIIPNYSQQDATFLDLFIFTDVLHVSGGSSTHHQEHITVHTAVHTVHTWRSWLRHCATSRKVAVSIPDGVIGIFHSHNLSGRTMALGSTQPLTEMSTRNISWRERRQVCRADNLTTIMCRLS